MKRRITLLAVLMGLGQWYTCLSINGKPVPCVIETKCWSYYLANRDFSMDLIFPDQTIRIAKGTKITVYNVCPWETCFSVRFEFEKDTERYKVGNKEFNSHITNGDITQTGP